MRSRTQHARQLISLFYRADPRRTVLSLLPVLPVAGAITFVAARNMLVANGTDDQEGLLLLVAVFGLAFGLSAWLGRVTLTARVQLGEAAAFEFELRRAMAVTAAEGIAPFERPEYLDRVQLLQERSAVITQAARMVGGMADAATALLIAAIMLYTVHPILCLVVLGGLPSAILSPLEHHSLVDARVVASERGRRALKFYDLTTRPEHVAEIQLAGVGDVLLHQYETDWRASDRGQFRAELLSSLNTTLGWLIQAVIFAIAIVVLVNELRDGTLPAADLFLAVGALGLIGGQLTYALTNARSLREVLWLFSELAVLEEDSTRDRIAGAAYALPRVLTSGITLRNVGFSYEDAAREVVRGISLQIPAGSIVALVGDNGAGKTTLSNLLLGLYRPTAGEIEVEGVSLSDLEVDAWRRGLSACFQDYAHLELSMRESVGVGDLAKLTDEHAILDAIDRAGAESLLESLPRGLDTQLGGRLGGSELSGGEWQRVAIARSMMRAEPVLLVLDEPSAALDAFAEAEILAHYRSQLASNARHATITILISHRLSSVRMADLVVVLSDGSIAELGTHDELISAGGRYAQMYELQAKHYK